MPSRALFSSFESYATFQERMLKEIGAAFHVLRSPENPEKTMEVMSFLRTPDVRRALGEFPGIPEKGKAEYDRLHRDWNKNIQTFFASVVLKRSWRARALMEVGIFPPSHLGHCPPLFEVIRQAHPRVPWVSWVKSGWLDARALDSERNSALHVASMAGNLDGIQKLLGLGLDPNQPNIRGETPVHAFFHGSADPTQSVAIGAALLEAGADFNRPDLTGRTPYHLAIRSFGGAPWYGLPSSAFDLTLRSPSGKTTIGLLLEACEKMSFVGHGVEMVRLFEPVGELLAAGAPVDKKDVEGLGLIASLTKEFGVAAAVAKALEVISKATSIVRHAELNKSLVDLEPEAETAIPRLRL